jgi:hypothetical protein
VVVPIPRPAEPVKPPCEHDPVKVEKTKEENDMLPYPSAYQNKYDNSTKTEINPDPRPPKYSTNFEKPSVGIPNSI